MLTDDSRTPQRRRRPTQADVARLAGVSQAMVSYVLTNRTTVTIPDDTRQRIVAAIEQLGYLPNSAARSLRTDRTHTIAGIIPDITNPFYSTFGRGIQDIAEQHGYDLVLYNTDGEPDKERKCLRSVEQRRTDGIVGVFFHLHASDLFPLLERGAAVVRLEARAKASGPYPLDNLYVDNRAAAQSAVEYLLGRGRRRIAMLAARVGPGLLRIAGYRQALELRGLHYNLALVGYCEFTERGGYEGMQRLLALPEPPDALFASNDMIALGALLAAKDAGLRIPLDLALMGFDDIPMARLVNPALTTVAQFQRELGQRAAELLFERLDQKVLDAGRSIEMPYQIIERESA